MKEKLKICETFSLKWTVIRDSVQIILSENDDDKRKTTVNEDDIILITERRPDPVFSELFGTTGPNRKLKRNNNDQRRKSKHFDETFCGGKGADHLA